MSKQKEVKELIRWLKRQGYRVERAKSGHWVAHAPARKVQIASTPSKSSWRRAALKGLKQAGIDISDWRK